MADVNANIGVNIDTSSALAQIKALQRQLSEFHTSIARSSDAAASAQRSLQTNLINSINSIGAFSAELRTVRTTAESFTNSLEKNKFSMREYFRYGMGATKTFGKFFTSEFDTISKVAEDRVKKMQTQYIKMGRDASGAMKAVAVIPNELDMSNLNTQLQIAGQRQALFNQLVKQGSTNLLNFGKNTQWAGRQLMVGFTLPLMTLGSTASRVFMDMETAAIKFRKVYGDLFTPAAETEKALRDIQELGSEFTKYGIAVSKTMNIAAEAAAAGFQGVDLQRQVKQATRLAVLGQLEQQKALETTISLQNAFKMSSEELAGAINFLNVVENQTVVTLDDITTAIPKVAPVIKQLGGDVKDLAFFMAAMREGGVNASEGANALKSGLGSLINPTKKASDMLMQMGINVEEIVTKNKGNLRATVVEFAQALNTLDPLQKQRALEQMFGKFQFARLNALFSNITQSGNQASRVLDLASESASSLAFIAEKELGITANSSMNKFRKSVEDLKTAIAPVGQVFLEILTPLIEKVSGIIEVFNGWSDGTKKTTAKIIFYLAGLGPIALMTFGLIANGIANIIKVSNVLRNGFLRLSGQTVGLGEQTQYLTTEQLEAAAVASSLEQAHARLTQQFTVEAGAVSKLRDAYERANIAAGNFALANPGMMTARRGRPPVRRANGGKISGPGTGTSDSIPAYLSNGEYVVQSSAVNKYGTDFFDALNAKKFAKGGMVIPKLYGGTPGGLNAIITQMFSGIGGLRSVKPRSGIKSGKKSGEARSSRKLMDEAYDPLSRARTVRDTEVKAKLQDQYGARFADDLILGHVYTPTFLKQFRSKASKGESPLVSGLEAQMLGAIGATSRTIKSAGQYQALPRTFMNIPEELNKNLLRGADKSLWRNLDGSDMISFLYEMMLMGVSPYEAKRMASDLASDINKMVSDSQGDINNISLGKIYERSSRKIFRQNAGLLSRFSFRGYSNGTNNVPGSGNRDTVAAMLTPGEAVIPKKQNKKYASLVQGIIADNIPGFIDGTGKVPSAYDLRKDKGLGGALAPNLVNMSHPGGLFTIADISSGESIQMLSMAMEDVIRKTPGVSVKGIDREIKDWASRNKDLIKQANERALEGIDLDEAFLDVRKKFNQDMEALGGNVSKLRASSETHLPRITKDFEEAQAYAKKMGLDLRTTSGITKLVTDLPNNVVAQQIGTRGKFQSYNPARGAAVSSMGGSFTQYGVPTFFILEDLRDSLRDVTLSTEHLSKTVDRQTDISQKTQEKQTASERKSAVLDKGSRKRKRTRGRGRAGTTTPSSMSGGDTVVVGNVLDNEDVPIRSADEARNAGKSPGRFRGMLSRLGKFKFNLNSLFIIPMVLPLIDQLPNKLAGVETAAGKTVLKFAAMGSAFGPKGALVGAIIGIGKAIYNNITKNIEDADEKAKAIAASLKVSETTATLFGGNIAAASAKFTPLPGKVSKANQEWLRLKQNAAEFKGILDQLPKEDPLKIAVEGLKGLKGEELTSRVSDFVTAQVASGGVGAKEAKGFTLAILTAIGAADQFGIVWKNVSGLVGSQTQALQSQFKALGNQYLQTLKMSKEDESQLRKLEAQRNRVQEQLKTAPNEYKESYQDSLEAIDKEIEKIKTKYDDASKFISEESKKSAQEYGNAILTVFSNAQAGAINAKDLNSAIDAMAASGMSATQQINALGAAIMASNDEQLISAWTKMGEEIKIVGSIAKNTGEAMKMAMVLTYYANNPEVIWQPLEDELNKGKNVKMNYDWSKLIQLYPKKARQALLDAFKKMNIDIETAFNINNQGDGDKDAGGTNKIISLINKEIDALRRKADALKKVNDEIDRNNEYQMRQMELSQQMAMAKISGDYIGAAIIGQRKAFETAEFNRTTEELALETRISNLEAIVSKMESKQKLTKSEKTIVGSIINKMAYGGKVVGPGTAMSDSVPAYLSNGEYVIRSSSVNKYGVDFLDNINAGKFAMGGMIKGPGTGRSDSILGFMQNANWSGMKKFKNGIIGISNGESIINAQSTSRYGSVLDSINRGSYDPNQGSVYNTITMNITGSNSEEIANKVIAKLNLVQNKNNGSNKVVI